MRRANRPSKQLLWFWLNELMQESARHDRGLDIACGDMQMQPVFKTNGYLGIDADAARLAEGMKRTGENGIVCRIQDIPPDVVGNFVLCLQTIGFNKNFDVRDSLLAVEKCAAATLPGGTLLVNLGHHAEYYFDESEALLKVRFRSVRRRSYGRWREPLKESHSYFLASLLRLFPMMARTSSKPSRLLVCRDRLAA